MPDNNNGTWTVAKGDTLTKIASATGTTVDKLVELNNITDRNYIVVGQVIKYSGSATKETNNTNKAVIKAFGIQSGTERTIYATWTWTKSNTENYKVMWYYATGDGVWFVANDGGSTVTSKQATYNAPSNATKVKFKVKPISKKKKSTGKETSYWTAEWSTEKIVNLNEITPPATPGVPDVELKDLKLTATLDNLDVHATHIQFQIVQDNEKNFKTVKVEITKAHASYSCSVSSGSEYKVRARSVKGDEYSDWSNYSANYGTQPKAPAKIKKIRQMDETSVAIDYTDVTGADSYEIQYTINRSYFNSNPSGCQSATSETGHCEITGLDPGHEYFFRVRAISDEHGQSGWTDIVSYVLGTKPSAPTTWSSTTSATTGQKVNLYWTHNSTDASRLVDSELEVYLNGIPSDGEEGEHFLQKTIVYDYENEYEQEKTNVYELDTATVPDGSRLVWRVRTRGITDEYSDWSVTRTIDIYEAPTLSLEVNDASGNTVSSLISFPLHIDMDARPSTQTPLSYYVSIISDETYETEDAVGNTRIINAGEAVYSKYFDISEPSLSLRLSAGDVDLENNVVYTVYASVAMNSGLTAEDTGYFKVAWTDVEYSPNAEIGIDEDEWYAIIRPHCEDEDGNAISNVSLAVYRREYNGTFTFIADDIDSGSNTVVTDPHPALDFARYRIVATDNNTGAISYTDIPGYPVGCKAAIIQWDEQWSAFDTNSEEAMEEPSWSGSMLKLPYNIDISDSNAQDVALIEYIGRENPVTYHGTQQGYVSTWNMDIPHDDIETLYGLRRLQHYMGDVYVREPSGTGYWANVKVSYSKKHKSVIIPVSLSITRVEGGI